MNLPKVPGTIAIAAVIGFIAVLAAYVVLVATGNGERADGLFPAVVTLLGVVGLGGHVERRTQQQNEQLDKQDEKLATITHQTNGVLDARIKSGADAAIRGVMTDLGYNVPPAPEVDPE